jgi:hypothetical protein
MAVSLLLLIPLLSLAVIGYFVFTAPEFKEIR